jgi:hypothetical protein
MYCVLGVMVLCWHARMQCVLSKHLNQAAATMAAAAAAREQPRPLHMRPGHRVVFVFHHHGIQCMLYAACNDCIRHAKLLLHWLAVAGTCKKA